MDKKIIPIKIEKIDSSIFQLTKIPSAILTKLRDKFAFLPEGYKFQPKFRLMGIKGVQVRLIQPDGTFPAGLFTDVVNYITNDLNKEIIMSHDVMEHFYPLTDLFANGVNDDVFSEYELNNTPILLRDYQLSAVQSAFENRNCLLNLSTGSGKCLGGSTLLNIKLPKELVTKYKHLIEK